MTVAGSQARPLRIKLQPIFPPLTRSNLDPPPPPPPPAGFRIARAATFYRPPKVASSYPSPSPSFSSSAFHSPRHQKDTMPFSYAPMMLFSSSSKSSSASSTSSRGRSMTPTTSTSSSTSSLKSLKGGFSSRFLLNKPLPRISNQADASDTENRSSFPRSRSPGWKLIVGRILCL